MLASRAQGDADATTMAEIVHFTHDASDLSAAAVSILNRKVTVLQANSTMRLAITGHASEPGTDQYNRALGLRRAEAIRAYLVSRGVNAERVEVSSAGRNERVAFGSGDAAHAANRRAEFRIMVAHKSHGRPLRGKVRGHNEEGPGAGNRARLIS